VVATGRSDFPNQVNNSVLFPAVFRGALDVRAKTISDGMVIAASKELAKFARKKGLSPTNIIPTMLDWDVFPDVAATIGEQAQREGLARKSLTRAELQERAKTIMQRTRNLASLLIQKGIIQPPPEHLAAGK
jgi:malate dehydrogenase (oxaloacetate-decarboxylating)